MQAILERSEFSENDGAPNLKSKPIPLHLLIAAFVPSLSRALISN